MLKNVMKYLSIVLFLFPVLSAQAQDKERIPLTLERAIAMAIEHDLDVAIQRESVKSAEAGVQESLGFFDPAIGSGYTPGRGPAFARR
jgi:hypothetical protein